MAVYTETAVRANLRVREGRRVFYLAQEDVLTPAARDWLTRQRVEILPAALAKPDAFRTPEGENLQEKPEQLTHLRADLLVPKTHPRIVFRGQVDRLQAELLLCIRAADEAAGPELAGQLRELLEAVRQLIRCDVLQEPWQARKLCGLTEQELREHSHFPQKYYDQPHFMPEPADSALLLRLNHLRTTIRQVEIEACRAFPDRTDLVQACNRMSSLLWILMIRRKKQEEENHGLEC